MDIKFANNASSRLAAAISDKATKLSVLPSMGLIFPELDLSTDYFMCTITDTSGAMEIIKVVRKDGDDFFVQRAQEGTTAKSFPQNSVIENRLTADSIQHILNMVDATNTTAGRVRFATREETVGNSTAKAAVTPAGLIDYHILPGIIVPFTGQFSGSYPINSLTGKPDPYWRLCDGTGGTPNLSDKFLMGSSPVHPSNTSGGKSTLKDSVASWVSMTAITQDEMPPHRHDYWLYEGFNWITSGSWYSGQNVNFNSGVVSGSGWAGGGAAHGHTTNMWFADSHYPPYYAVSYIMRLAR